MNGAELVMQHGMLLQSARGPIPNLAELVAGEPIRVEIDGRDLQGGQKNWEWIKKGVPLRVELGPRDLEDLVTLPGVGRKTANVVRSVAFDLPGLPVDTHVARLVRRLKLTNETDPVKIELDLNGIIEPDEQGKLSLRLILHGRKVCTARKPRCDICVLNDICPSAFKV